jgi:hypothetical protein
LRTGGETGATGGAGLQFVNSVRVSFSNEDECIVQQSPVREERGRVRELGDGAYATFTRMKRETA